MGGCLSLKKKNKVSPLPVNEEEQFDEELVKQALDYLRAKQKVAFISTCTQTEWGSKDQEEGQDVNQVERLDNRQLRDDTFQHVTD